MDIAVTTINILAALGKFSFYVFLVLFSLSIFAVLKILTVSPALPA